VLLLIVGAPLIAFRVMDPEKRTLNARARAQAPGSFVRLSNGTTHYELAGPDTGRVVVLAAAFSVPAWISDSLFQGLADSGFRVLRFDYFGRGWSDRLDTVYDQDLFVNQLAELLDSLRIPSPIDLAGVSFGAAIATSVVEKYPGRIHALIYVDPVFNYGRKLRKEERTKLAWDYYMVFRGGTDAMARSQLDDFYHPERHPDWVDRYRVQQQFKGTREALRRTRVAIETAPHQGELLRKLGQDPRPVLVVWGRQDTGAPFSESTSLLQTFPHATLVAVDSAGHLPHLDQPQIVIPAVVRFLRRSH
jgi:pimeloyl-ACP methyl ester carboxylesterase